MKKKTEYAHSKHLSLIGAVALSIVVLSIFHERTYAIQLQPQGEVEKKRIKQRISTIFRETLQSGEITTASGQKVIMRVPPSAEYLREVKSYGDAAVPPLVEHLKSEDAREYELAMRFLGELGGERIIPPLRDIILYDPVERKREYAVRWITQAPWDKAAPILRFASKNDPDERVRQLAEEMLRDYSPHNHH